MRFTWLHPKPAKKTTTATTATATAQMAQPQDPDFAKLVEEEKLKLAEWVKLVEKIPSSNSGIL